MDPVVELEHRITALQTQQRTRRCTRQRYWQLQDEIDVLDAEARRITAGQREATSE